MTVVDESQTPDTIGFDPRQSVFQVHGIDATSSRVLALLMGRGSVLIIGATYTELKSASAKGRAKPEGSDCATGRS